jgi:hypothetical protein
MFKTFVPQQQEKGLDKMNNAALVKNLRKLVDVHGAAQVAVWLGYKDTRSINNWVSTSTIPRARVERVRSVLNEHQKGA